MTALTRENLAKWAKRRVDQEPTYTESRWNEERQEFVAVAEPNTIVRELTSIVMANFIRSISEYDNGDLVGLLIDFAQYGLKGHITYTETEALDEITHELIDPDNSTYTFGSLEDLLDEFDLSD